MARLLQKAIRGGAAVGAQMSMEQYRANIEQQRMERLQQYQTGQTQADQAYRTGEREATQAFAAEQNRLDREHRAGLESQKLAAKGDKEWDGKVPEYEKHFSKKAGEAVGGQLREDGSWRFESQDDARRAALLEKTANDIYLNMPADQRRTDVAYSQALSVLRAHDAQPSETELDMELDAEAKKRKGFFKDDFGGLSEQEWRDQQKQKRLAESQGLISSAMQEAGLKPSQPMQGETGDFTQEDLEFTAQKHGITVEEVKKRLGIQ